MNMNEAGGSVEHIFLVDILGFFKMLLSYPTHMQTLVQVARMMTGIVVVI